MSAAKLEKIYLKSGICGISQVPLFNNRTASPLVGEAEFQHEERVLEIQVRGNLRIVTEAGSHNSFLVGSLCSSRGEALLTLVRLTPQGWEGVSGISLFVLLNLFQHLATVIELQVGFTNPTTLYRSFNLWKLAILQLKPPTPALPLKGGWDFQAYQYRSNAINTSFCAYRILSLRGGFSVGRRVSEANPARLVPVGRYSAGTPNNPIRTE